MSRKSEEKLQQIQHCMGAARISKKNETTHVRTASRRNWHSIRQCEDSRSVAFQLLLFYYSFSAQKYLCCFGRRRFVNEWKTLCGLTFDSKLTSSAAWLVSCKSWLPLGRANVVECVQNKNKHNKNHCKRILIKWPWNSLNFRNNFTTHCEWHWFNFHWADSLFNTSPNFRQFLWPRLWWLWLAWPLFCPRSLVPLSSPLFCKRVDRMRCAGNSHWYSTRAAEHSPTSANTMF